MVAKMTALEEQRKQLLAWLFLFPPEYAATPIARSYHAMRPKHEVIYAKQHSHTQSQYTLFHVEFFSQ
jgi:hypothetical protein|tara:strand:+ start:3374 stop:3577 length:204 start_codon:yes stop_codon:yes gene_type:complete